jgi:PAS domain S-box-containing protein
VKNAGWFAHSPANPTRRVGAAEESVSIQEKRSGPSRDVLTRAGDPGADSTLSRALAAAHVGTWSYDQNTRREFWDATTKSLFGLAPDEEPNTELFISIVHPDDRRVYAQAFARAVDPAGSGHYECDFRIHRPDTGEERWLSSRGQSEFADGAFVRLVGVVLDATNQKLAETAARAGEERVRRVLDSLFAFVGMLDLEGTLCEVNRAPLERAGVSLAEAIGKKFWDTYWWSYDHAVQERLKNAVRRALLGEIARYEEDVRVIGGELIKIDFQLAPLRDERGRITHLVASGTDISERKRIEEQLSASEERFRELADNISQFAWMAQGSGYVYWYNKRWFDFTGTTLQDMEGWGWKRVQHPDHVERVVQSFSAAVRNGQPWEDTFPIRGRDGNYRWFLSRALPIRDAAGQVMRWFGTNTDVTDLREAEARLREREVQLAQFIEDAPVAIAMFDKNMRYVAASRRYSIDFGTPPPNELIGREHYDTIPDIPQRWRDIDSRVLAGEELAADEDPFPRADGSLEWVRWSMKPWRDADDRIGGALLFSEIVTDEVEARHALAASEQRFRGVFENAGIGIALVSLEGVYERCNPAFVKMTGYSEDELRSMNMRSLIHPDDLPPLIEINDKLIGGDIPSFEITNRYVCKDGGIRWTRRFISMLCDPHGRPANVMVLATDMTERIAYENKIGLLLREVNHRAKNMLGVVQAIARSTASSGAEDFQARFAERIRALAAAHDLLVSNDWQGVELADLVTSQLAHFTDLIGSRISVEGPALRISGAAAQTLGMALHELATNAFKYGALSEKKGRVSITWRRDEESFTMEWIERGGPPAKEPERSGFGTVVLDRMTRMALGGEIKLQHAEEGFGWRLRCPISKITPTPLASK